MPLLVGRSTPLRVPAGYFNADGLAVLMLHGGRRRVDWSIAASAVDKATVGKIQTSVDDSSTREPADDAECPDRAIETAFIWVVGEAQQQGLRVVAFECLNHLYGPAERASFCLARAVVANQSFRPTIGVTYADQMTLAAVMRYPTSAGAPGPPRRV